MKNIELLEKLKNIENYLKDCTTKEKALEKLSNLILDVKTEVLAEENKETTSKQRITYVMKWHKKMLKTIRPILAYSCSDNEEGIQVVTDSYFMAFLNNEDNLPIPDYKEYNNGRASYPNTTQLYKKVKNGEKIKLDINKIQTILKTQEDILTEYNGKKLIFNKERIKNLVTFLNIKNNDKTIFKLNGSILNVEKTNGTCGMLMIERLGSAPSNLDINEILIQE